MEIEKNIKSVNLLMRHYCRFRKKMIILFLIILNMSHPEMIKSQFCGIKYAIKPSNDPNERSDLNLPIYMVPPLLYGLMSPIISSAYVCGLFSSRNYIERNTIIQNGDYYTRHVRPGLTRRVLAATVCSFLCVPPIYLGYHYNIICRTHPHED
jgi:hypothetical protein